MAGDPYTDMNPKGKFDLPGEAGNIKRKRPHEDIFITKDGDILRGRAATAELIKRDVEEILCNTKLDKHLQALESPAREGQRRWTSREQEERGQEAPREAAEKAEETDRSREDAKAQEGDSQTDKEDGKQVEVKEWKQELKLTAKRPATGCKVEAGSGRQAGGSTHTQGSRHLQRGTDTENARYAGSSAYSGSGVHPGSGTHKARTGQGGNAVYTRSSGHPGSSIHTESVRHAKSGAYTGGSAHPGSGIYTRSAGHSGNGAYTRRSIHPASGIYPESIGHGRSGPYTRSSGHPGSRIDTESAKYGGKGAHTIRGEHPGGYPESSMHMGSSGHTSGILPGNEGYSSSGAHARSERYAGSDLHTGSRGCSASAKSMGHTGSSEHIARGRHLRGRGHAERSGKPGGDIHTASGGQPENRSSGSGLGGVSLPTGYDGLRQRRVHLKTEETYGSNLAAQVAEKTAHLRDGSSKSEKGDKHDEVPASREEAKQWVTAQLKHLGQRLEQSSKVSVAASSQDSKATSQDSKISESPSSAGTRRKPFGAQKNIRTLDCYHTDSTKDLKSLGKGGNIVGFQD